MTVHIWDSDFCGACKYMFGGLFFCIGTLFGLVLAVALR